MLIKIEPVDLYEADDFEEDILKNHKTLNGNMVLCKEDNTFYFVKDRTLYALGAGWVRKILEKQNATQHKNHKPEKAEVDQERA